MGRLFIKLDPGARRNKEPGYAKRWTAKDIMAAMGESSAVFNSAKFWNPPGCDWILPKPLQWESDWYKDPHFGMYLISKPTWHFATGIDPATVDDVEYTRTPDGFSRPLNTYMKFTVNETSLMDNRNYGAMATECEIANLPADFRTVAFVTQSPYGPPICDGQADLCPWFSWESYPAPHDWIAFGFGDYALLANATQWWIVRNRNSQGKPDGGQSWEQQDTGYFVGSPGMQHLGGAGPGLDTPASDEPIVKRRYFSIIPIGFTDAYVTFERSGSLLLTGLRPHNPSLIRSMKQPALFGKGSGSWWIATAPGTVCFQAQVLGFNTASSDNVPKKKWFSTGKQYKPSRKPGFVFDALVHAIPGETASTVEVDNQQTVTISGESTEKIIVGVRDTNRDPWVSDGTHYEGEIRIKLEPDHFLYPQYLAPQLRAVNLTFPEVTEARPNVELELDDTQWKDLSVEVSLRQIDGKKIKFGVTDRARSILGDLGLDTREGYPLEIWEEMTEGDEESRVLRVTGWVHKVEYSEPKMESEEGSQPPLQELTFEARGELTRAAERWSYLPEMIDPDDPKGRVGHDFAIKMTLRSTGMDINDLNRFRFYDDPWHGTELYYLPALKATPNGLKDEGPGNPDWHETRSQYMDRIAQEWRGWILYEGLRKIRYHPDLQYALQVGSLFYPVAGFYRTVAEAADAGYEGQWVEGNPTAWLEPLHCNTVMIVGKTPEDAENGRDPNRAVICVRRNLKSLNTEDDPNFLGDERTAFVVSKLAVTRPGLKQVTKSYLFRKGHRKRGPRWSVQMFPWEIEPAPQNDDFDIGQVVNLAGRGDHLLIHMSFKINGRSRKPGRTYNVRTVFAGEKLVVPTARGSVEGDYPGQGLAGEAED